MNRGRNFPPGLYNERRLFEKPIPTEASDDESYEEVHIPNGMAAPINNNNNNTLNQEIIQPAEMQPIDIPHVNNSNVNGRGK